MISSLLLAVYSPAGTYGQGIDSLLCILYGFNEGSYLYELRGSLRKRFLEASERMLGEQLVLVFSAFPDALHGFLGFS